MGPCSTRWMRGGVSAIALVLSLASAFGAPGAPSGTPPAPPQQPRVHATFQNYLEANGSNEAQLLLQLIDRYITDIGFTSGAVLLRDTEADELLDRLVQSRLSPGTFPVIFGESGAGKSSVVLRAAQKMLRSDFPSSPVHRNALEDTLWIQTQPSLLAAQVDFDVRSHHYKFLRQFFAVIRYFEKKLQRKIVLVVDNIHTLTRDQAGAFSALLAGSSAPAVIGTSTSEGFQLKFKDFPELQKKAFPIALRNFQNDELIRVLERNFLLDLQKEFSVTFDPEITALIVKNATRVFPDRNALSAAQTLLREIAMKKSRESYPTLAQSRTLPAQQIQITLDDALNLLSEKAGYPIHPLDVKARTEFAAQLKSKVNAEIQGQERMVGEVSDLALSILDDASTGMGVAVMIGPSGTGKTELGRSIAQHLFGNPQAFLAIDANEYKTGGHSLMKLFGAENGILTSDTKSGILPEFFDDPARGKYRGVILIDEGERASPDFWEKLMEFFDRGSFVGGDGKRRFARQHLVLITSNRGEKILFPEGSEKWGESEMQARLQKLTQPDLKNLFLRKTSGRDKLEIPAPVLNRVNLFTVSRPLSRDAMQRIVSGILSRFAQKQKEQLGVEWVFDQKALDALVPSAPSRLAGARPIIHQTREALRKLRDQVLEQSAPKAGDVIQISADLSLNKVELVAGASRVALAAPPVTDPLRDPRVRQLLQEFPDILRAHLIGQDEAIESAIHSLRSHLGTPEELRRPLSFFAVGPTGTGKTEFGRGIAHALYGSPERAAILPMGEITSPEKLTRFFGSDPGYVGSEDERAFEKALQANPQGGVLIFDEASNVGGGHAGLKEALFKTLYPLIEEGKWTSSATGVEYDLRNYVFLFTGNDGDHLFDGTSADDLRLATWERHKSKASVLDMLVKSGIPLPFLGRMADLFLFKPLMRNEVAAIVRIQMKPLFQSFEKAGYHFELAPEFAEHFAELFFTAKTGARSLRSLINDRLRSMITELIMSVDQSVATSGTLTLSTREISPKTPFLVNPLKDQPRAFLEATLRDASGMVISSVQYDATGAASFPKRLPFMEALKTAYHEAGHAVMNDTAISGKKLRHLTILGSEGNLGYAHSDRVPGAEFISPIRSTVIHEMAVLMAGQVATMLAGHPPDAGWASDLQMARSLASRYLKQWGFGAGLAGTDLNAEGTAVLSPAQQDLLSVEMNAMLREAVVAAEAGLSDRWGLVFLTMRELMKKGSISGERLDDLTAVYQKNQRWKGQVPAVRGSKKSCADLLIPAPTQR